MWLASSWAIAFTTSPSIPSQFINDKDLKNHEFIANWLTNVGPSKTDREDADRFFSLGLKAKQAKNWSGAAKMFGESMMRYPSPHALYESADSELRMLRQVRAREGFPPERVRKDMNNALDLYESSLAANGVTKTLSAQEIERIEQYVFCLKSYLQSPQPQTDCQPTVYFSSEQVKSKRNRNSKH